jgi:hypothetical protein
MLSLFYPIRFVVLFELIFLDQVLNVVDHYYLIVDLDFHIDPIKNSKSTLDW